MFFFLLFLVDLITAEGAANQAATPWTLNRKTLSPRIGVRYSIERWVHWSQRLVDDNNKNKLQDLFLTPPSIPTHATPHRYNFIFTPHTHIRINANENSSLQPCVLKVSSQSANHFQLTNQSMFDNFSAAGHSFAHIFSTEPYYKSKRC